MRAGEGERKEEGGILQGFEGVDIGYRVELLADRPGGQAMAFTDVATSTWNAWVE